MNYRPAIAMLLMLATSSPAVNRQSTDSATPAVGQVALNGQLQAPGPSDATNNDVYLAGTAASGEMAFEDDLFEGDVIQVIKLV